MGKKFVFKMKDFPVDFKQYISTVLDPEIKIIRRTKKKKQKSKEIKDTEVKITIRKKKEKKGGKLHKKSKKYRNKLLIKCSKKK